ncbi:MAG: hypothetical protein P8104_08585 [Gammaproteobacteria bacterium]
MPQAKTTVARKSARKKSDTAKATAVPKSKKPSAKQAVAKTNSKTLKKRQSAVKTDQVQGDGKATTEKKAPMSASKAGKAGKKVAPKEAMKKTAAKKTATKKTVTKKTATKKTAVKSAVTAKKDVKTKDVKTDVKKVGTAKKKAVSPKKAVKPSSDVTSKVISVKTPKKPTGKRGRPATKAETLGATASPKARRKVSVKRRVVRKASRVA